MKKWISLLLAMALVMLFGVVAIAESGSIRHEVTGDVSEFDVVEEAGLDRADGPKMTIGTDVYLFVDPDTASYVTFYVTDEEGNPIEGALIYIGYNGKEQLFGVTDENGKLSTYLFRNTEYSYRVVKSGYETATGTFTATEETKIVHIVLRKLHNLTIIVVENGVPQKDILVYIDGKPYRTDEEGKVTVRVPNGEYNVVVVAPDGREIPLLAVVDGDTVIIVELAADNSLVEGGRYHDNFLVYNKFYNPEDYVLTQYEFKAEDLERMEGETDEEFALRTARYLEQHPSTILVEAQPQRQQNGDGTDTDLYKPDGTLLYTQRSMMPTGHLLKIWEEMGYTGVVFTNEDAGIRFDMSALHTGDMAKLYALIGAMDSGKNARTIVKEEMRTSASVSRMNRLTEETIEVGDIDFDVIRDFEFTFDHEHESEGVPERDAHELLDDSLYTNTLFEFRITPILKEALRDMITDGLTDEPALVKDTIMLASKGYYSEELRRWRADGRMTETECSELYAYVIDGMLTPAEIEELRAKVEDDTLSEDAVDLLLDAVIDEKAYRLSCWVIYGNAKINVTTLLDGMITLWKADEQYEAAFDAQMAAAGENADEKAAALAAKAELEAAYDLMTVDNLNKLYTDADYTAGDNTAVLDVQLVCSMPAEDDEFYAQVHDRWFNEITVDVRKEPVVLSGKNYGWYRAYFSYGTTQLATNYALTAPNETCGLAVLVNAQDNAQ